MVNKGKSIYLCRPNGEKICVLNGVDTSTVLYEEHLKDYDELSFTVDRYIEVDGTYIESNGYDMLHAYMELLIEDVGRFQMQEPSTANDGNRESKSILAYSLEKEFEDKDYVKLKVNTGERDSLEYLVPENVNELGFAKNYIVFYDEKNPSLSLLNYVLEKMPGWSIGYIDPMLHKTKWSFDEDNINLYAFLTSTLAPKAECIFTFDTLAKKINAYSKHNLDYDTNIFIGFRNLLNSVDITTEEDSIYTRFNVLGEDDLDISNVNFNETKIININYFLNTDYVSQELIDKFRAWWDYRYKDLDPNVKNSSRRHQFINLSKQWADLTDKIYEITYRQPSDGTNWDQWNKMEEDLLKKNLSYYNKLLESLQISVDPNVDNNPRYSVDSNGNIIYTPWKKPDGSVDHDKYLELLHNMENGYGGYYSYFEILTYIIPYIQMAIDNLGKPEDDKQEPVEGESWETNWDLYGISELEAKIKTYREDKMKPIENYAKPWDSLTPEQQKEFVNGADAYNKTHDLYKKYEGFVGNESTPGTILYKLKQLNAEVDELNTKLDSVTKSRTDMIEDVSMSNSRFGFTEEDFIKINTLFHDTDYQNSNILTTSIDTTLSKIDVQETLYQDAVSKLSEVSQPQYSFSIQLDNLMEIEEFKDWIDDLKILNYIRLGIRDNYSVKLRYIGRSWNPCDITPDLQLKFSNMITSKSGRNDFTDILDSENNRGAKNSISIADISSHADDDSLNNLLQHLINMQGFGNAVTNLAGNVNIDEGTFYSLAGEYLKVTEINVDKIIGDEASFNKFFATYLDVDTIVGDSAIFKNLTVDVANIESLLAGHAGVGDLQAIHLTANNVIIDNAVIKDLIASKISVADLSAHSASAELITLISSSTGAPTIAFKDSTQQFYDADGHVRVQIGQDASGDFSFIVRGTDGTTALFNENGVTSNAIADGLIVNNMIQSGTINKDRLSFPIIEANEHGGVDITQIYDGKGNLWGIQYNQFKETVSSGLNDVTSGLNDVTSGLGELDQKIENSIQFKLEVLSSNGLIFSNSVINTTLTPVLYRGNDDVTDQYGDECFIWHRLSDDQEYDKYWDSQHAPQKQLRITNEDVYKITTFRCDFVLENTVLASSQI